MNVRKRSSRGCVGVRGLLFISRIISAEPGTDVSNFPSSWRVSGVVVAEFGCDLGTPDRSSWTGAYPNHDRNASHSHRLVSQDVFRVMPAFVLDDQDHAVSGLCLKLGRSNSERSCPPRASTTPPITYRPPSHQIWTKHAVRGT